MKHVILRNPRLNGWEYGMLRAFEDAIIQITGASVFDIPVYSHHRLFSKVQHGMRMDVLRNVLPAKKIDLEADVVWCILMGPENLNLDLFKGWDHIPHRIVYLFDTLPPQYGLMKKLFSSDAFNIKITSFDDAKPDLEKLTGQPWRVIEQAGARGTFHSIPFNEKIIHFSAYGRKIPGIHEALMEFCSKYDLYYDYTTHQGAKPTADSRDLYKQYAWHLNHSLFTISWPVELTHPLRAGHLNPITCRWFEAACAATTIIGRKPENPSFDQYLFPELVVPLDPQGTKTETIKQLEKIWERRETFYQATNLIQQKLYPTITWENRVSRILKWLDNPK